MLNYYLVFDVALMEKESEAFRYSWEIEVQLKAVNLSEGRKLMQII